MKIRRVGAELFHADRRTGHNEDKSRFFAILRTRIITRGDRRTAIPMYDRRKASLQLQSIMQFFVSWLDSP